VIAGSQISVVSGGSDRLFLKAFASNEYLLAASDLADWRREKLPRLIANYVARHRRMAERGVPFFVVFGPEASGIYPEHLPEGYKIQSPTACEILAQELSARGVQVICPSEAMRRAKGPVDVCLKLDSHWSNFGAYICYREIMDALGAPFNIATVPWQEVYYEERIGYGDLGVQVKPERKGYVQHVKIPNYAIEASKNIFDIRDKNLRWFRNQQGVGKALVYRDSFTNALSPFFEATFAETYLVAPAPAMLDSAVDQFKPDVVILEVAERALFGYEDPFADWSARTFAQEYLETADNPAGGRLQVQALTAIHEGRFDDAVALAATAIVCEGETPRIYNLAWALHRKGRFDLCYQITSHASDKLNDPFVYYLEADSASFMGNTAGAIEAITKALEIQPMNALYLFLRGEWLLQLGESELALEALKRSIDYAPLHDRSWSRAIDASDALGGHNESMRLKQARAEVFQGGQ